MRVPRAWWCDEKIMAMTSRIGELAAHLLLATLLACFALAPRQRARAGRRCPSMSACV